MKYIKVLLVFVLLFAMSISKMFAQFTQYQTFPDGLSIVCTYDFADTFSRSKRLGKKYNHVTSHNEKFILYANYRRSVVDATGNVIIPESYQMIIRNEDIFEVRKDGRHKLIDSEGKIICESDFLVKMSDTTYRIRRGGKWGVVDLYGKEIIPCKYRHIGNISNNNTTRIKNERNRHAIMNDQGKMLVSWYDYINESEGVYIVRKDGKRGVADFYGKEIIPCEYDFIVRVSSKDR